jgi:hypothetical protein
MYISHKSNILQQVQETEWQCRRLTKGMTKPEYWDWIETITSGDPPVVDLSGETGYVIVECTDEDVSARLNQLDDYVAFSFDIGRFYNIKWSDSKVSAVTGQDIEGEDITIQTHFSGDDSAKDARLLADEWTRIRRERTQLLAETDHLALSDQTLSVGMTTYRQELRDLPSDQSSKTTYADITWPTEPE